jgi:octanoyl-[GcvH]:protein N-octanoyltransferase
MGTEVRVVRGRAASVEADREFTADLLAGAKTGQPALRVWRPHRQVAFGPRDIHSDGYDRAREVADERDYAVCERSVGGRAVAYSGTTVAFARIEPVEDMREGVQQRYATARVDLRAALGDLGVDARRGEPEGSFCPGSQSLQAGRSGKLVGIAQRVQQDAAMVAGVVIVDDHAEIAETLAPIYDALGLDFDPRSVGSIAKAGGEPDPVGAILRIEDELLGDRLASVEWLGE